MNWKTYVHKQNAKTYVLPKGWDSRETVAEQLECSPERVPDLLRPGLKSGEIEAQEFPVWDPVAKRLTRVKAYRQRAEGEGAAPAQATVPKGWTDAETAKAQALKEQGKTYREIGAAVGRTPSAVRKRLAR